MGLGDGPREPTALIPGIIEQGPFRYELTEQPDTWTLIHDRRGTFAEVVFSKVPVKIDAFRGPARQQVNAADSGWLSTLAVMKRRNDEAHVLRGRVYDVTGHQDTRHIVQSRREWQALLTSQFGIYLGNLTDDQQYDLWHRVSVAHEKWLGSRAQGGDEH